MFPNSSQVLVGVSVHLRCQATDVYGPVIVGWRVEGDGVYQVLDDGSLLISSATLEHNGSYTCTAANDFGEAHTTTHLHVLSELLGNPLLTWCCSLCVSEVLYCKSFWTKFSCSSPAAQLKWLGCMGPLRGRGSAAGAGFLMCWSQISHTPLDPPGSAACLDTPCCRHDHRTHHSLLTSSSGSIDILWLPLGGRGLRKRLLA